MAAHPVLEPLIAAAVTATIRPDGLISVTPKTLITPALDAYIRAHRDELVAALGTPLDWPPPEPEWFRAWMREDDARRHATMAAAMQCKADNNRSRGRL
jgi:hypothetical protein